MIVNLNSIVQHVIAIKNEIMINFNVSVKPFVRVKNIIVGVLVYALVRVLGTSKVLLILH